MVSADIITLIIALEMKVVDEICRYNMFSFESEGFGEGYPTTRILPATNMYKLYNIPRFLSLI